MPANISTSETGNHRFISRREAAWHGLGTVFPGDMTLTAEEAVVLAECDYEVQKYPMIINLPTGPVASDQVALVRVPQVAGGSYHVLGNAGKRFEVVQNMEIAALLNPLAREWQVETVGALGEGEAFFICLDAGSASVKGEEIRQYLLVNNNHDGRRSLHVALTWVRTVCENTLRAGLESAVINAKIPHRTEIREDAAFTLNLIQAVKKQQADMIKEFRAMAAAKVVEDQVREIIAKTYPDPRPTRKQMTAGIVVNDEKMLGLVNDNRIISEKLMAQLKTYGTEYQERVDRTEALRAMAWERYDLTCQESSVIAGTVWGAYQGITEVENYRGDGGKGTSNSILWGERAQNMSRAYAACKEMAGIN